jgi:hypothetical protein
VTPSAGLGEAPDVVVADDPSELTEPTEPAPSARVAGQSRHRAAPRPGTIVRIASHLVIWSVIWVPTVAELSKGWRPLFDDATISQRAFQVFSLHSPLVGPYSVASNSGTHPVFDLGPLLFWLLAVPVHIDPAQGALWGAAVCGAVVLSVAAEAAWARAGWIGCAAVAAVVVDLAWTEPEVFRHLVWNPYIGLVFFVASVVLALVVASGSLGWWPVLVLTASVASQCHLVFAITAVALALLAPVVGLIRGGLPGRARWLWAGIGVGVACWIAPLIQQFTTNPGNLTLLARTGRHQAGMGSAFGLQVLAGLSSPHPIWLVRSSPDYKPTLELVHGHPAVVGVVVLVLVGAVTVLAWVFGKKDLAAAGAVAAICSLGTVVTFTSFPAADWLLITYLHIFWWIPGILLWVVAGWALVLVARAAVRRLTDRPGGTPPQPIRQGPGGTQTQPWTHGRRWGWVAVLAACALVISTLFGARNLVVPASALDVDWSGVAQVDRISPAVEALVPRGPVALEFAAYFRLRFPDNGIALGVVYRLTVDGWHPGLYGPLGETTGSVVPPGSRWPIVIVTLRAGSATPTVARSG